MKTRCGGVVSGSTKATSDEEDLAGVGHSRNRVVLYKGEEKPEHQVSTK
jgi:hypothetical protein